MTHVVIFDEADPMRLEKEAALAAMDDTALAQALADTRRAAADARARAQMDQLFNLVRGMKTIHRIANQRGLILKRPRMVEGP